MKLTIFLASVLFALGAAPAYADPVTALATTVFAWAGGAAVALAHLAIGFGASLLSGAILKAKAGTQKYEASVSFDVTFGDDAALSFVVGDYATAGKQKYIGSWGRNTRFITEVYEYSCLPQGLSGIWVNDEKGVIASGYGCVPASQLSAIGSMIFSVKTINSYGAVPAGSVFVGHPVTTSDMGGRPAVFVKWIDGTQTEADPFLVAAFGKRGDYPWTAEMIGTGKSYAVVTTVYDKDIMSSRPAFLFEVAPLAMYDPRKDSTVGGSGSHRWGERTTYEPSANPAVISYNIVRGIYWREEWVFGGRNLDAWRLPRAEWVAAMVACEAAVDLGDGTSEPAYRVGAEISVDATGADVLEELGKGANMRFAEIGGRIKPLVGLPGASVFSITDGDILITKGQSLTPFPSVSETWNRLTATYPEPAEKWASKDAPEYSDPEALAADGGRDLPTSVTYGAVPHADQVQRLMRSQLTDYRRMRRHSFSLPPEAYALEPLDMITWDSARNGYEGKHFLIESVTRAAGMTVAVTLREVDPSDYDWKPGYALPYTTTTPVNPIPYVQEISGWTAVPTTITNIAGVSRMAAILVGCDPDETGVERVRIQIRKLGDADPTLDVIRAYDDPWRWTITGVAGGTAYEVRGALVSTLSGAFLWSDWISVTTAEILVTPDTLAGELAQSLGALEAWISGGVTDLPKALTDLAQALEVEVEARAADAGLSAARWRETRDTVQALIGQANDLAAADYSAREAIRQSLTATIGEMRASYDLQIVTLAAADEAAALKIETLEAASDTLSAEIQQVSQSQVDGDQALAQLISDLSVGTATQFDTALSWRFDTGAEGWTGGVEPVAWIDTGSLRAGDYLVSPSGLGLSASAYAQFRARLLLSGAPVWSGWLWWAAPGDDWSAERRVTIPEPLWSGDEGMVTIAPGWTGTIDRIRLDLAATVATETVINAVDADWIAIGAPAPGASSADIARLTQARIAGDAALAEDITTLQSALAATEGSVTGLATAVGGLQESVEQQGAAISAQTEALTALQSSVDDPETGNAALGEAVDQLKSTVQYDDGSQEVQSGAIRDLSSQLRAMAAEVADGTARAALQQGVLREATARATQSLDTRVTSTEDGIEALAEDVSRLEAEITGKADVTALDSLTATVSEQGDAITAQGQQITDLGAKLDTAEGEVSAQGDALSSLTSTVTQQGDAITAQGQQITALSATLGTTQSQVDAQANALSTLQAGVTGQGDQITSLSESLVSLDATVGGFSAENLFRATAYATPEGALSRVGLTAAASFDEGQAVRTAALYLEAIAGDKSRVLVVADQFVVINDDGVSVVPFYVEDGKVYIDTAVFKEASIDGAKIAIASIDSAQIRALAVQTVHVAGNSITVAYVADNAAVQNLSAGWSTRLSLTFPVDAGDSAVIIGNWQLRAGTGSGDTVYPTSVRMLVNGAEVSGSQQSVTAYIGFVGGGFPTISSFSAAGTCTVQIQAYNAQTAVGSVAGLKIGVLRRMR